MLVPLDDSIMALEQDSEATGSVGAGGRLTTGAAPTAVNQPGTPTSSAVKSPAVIPAATTPLNDGIKVAFSTVKIPGSQVDKSQVDKSQGSFAAINKLLHSFTSSSTRQPKHAVKKAIALTDAQVQQLHFLLLALL